MTKLNLVRLVVNCCIFYKIPQGILNRDFSNTWLSTFYQNNQRNKQSLCTAALYNLQVPVKFFRFFNFSDRIMQNIIINSPDSGRITQITVYPINYVLSISRYIAGFYQMSALKSFLSYKMMKLFCKLFKLWNRHRYLAKIANNFFLSTILQKHIELKKIPAHNSFLTTKNPCLVRWIFWIWFGSE